MTGLTDTEPGALVDAGVLQQQQHHRRRHITRHSLLRDVVDFVPDRLQVATAS